MNFTYEDWLKDSSRVGRYVGVPEAAYHLHTAMSQSLLKEFLNTPANYLQAMLDSQLSTKAQEDGDLYHTWMLSRHIFDQKYVEAPFNNFSLKPYKEWKKQKALEGDTRIHKKSKDLQKMRDMEAVFMQDKDHRLAELIANSDREVTYIYRHAATGIRCKCRIDIEPHSHRMLLDLKTTCKGGAHPVKFRKSIQNFGYHIQGAFYIDAVRSFHGLTEKQLPDSKFWIIAQETKAPYLCNLIPLSENFLIIGRHIYEEGMSKFKRWQSGELVLPKGYPPFAEGIEPEQWYETCYLEMYNLGE